MFIHEAPIFLLALPGLSAGCGTHTPGWSSGAEASATQAHRKRKHSSAGEERKKDLMILSPVLIWQGINLLTDGSMLRLIDAPGGFLAYEGI